MLGGAAPSRAQKRNSRVPLFHVSLHSIPWFPNVGSIVLWIVMRCDLVYMFVDSRFVALFIGHGEDTRSAP